VGILRLGWLAVIVTIFAFHLSIVAESRADDWQTYAHDIQHTSRSSATLNPAALHYAWTAPSGYSIPLIIGDNVIATRRNGSPTVVTSFKLSDGSVNWSYDGNGIFGSPAGYGYGLIAVAAESRTNSNDRRVDVLDASTGTLKYSVPANLGVTKLMPAIHRDPVSGATTAYIGSGNGVIAVGLGGGSGSVLFSGSGSVGGSSMPTVLGESILMAGPAHYYAYNRSTGATNQFHSGNLSGGGGVTIAADADANRFYVLAEYEIGANSLTAYSYTDNSNISQLWRVTDVTTSTQYGSVAIGPTGKLYSVGGGLIAERDPVTGNILRSTPAISANNVTPVFQDHYLWTFNNDNTLVYDLNTLTLVRTLPGSRGSSSSEYDNGIAISDNHLVIDMANNFNRGFDVYAVPEPASLSVIASVVGLLCRPRRTSPANAQYRSDRHDHGVRAA
jgi:hypothetical protein